MKDGLVSQASTKPTLKTKFINYLKTKSLFWRLYWWWGVRQAGIRRREKERRLASTPTLTHDEYWDKVHNKDKS